jgi:hypothetical protein
LKCSGIATTVMRKQRIIYKCSTKAEMFRCPQNSLPSAVEGHYDQWLRLQEHSPSRITYAPLTTLRRPHNAAAPKT